MRIRELYNNFSLNLLREERINRLEDLDAIAVDTGKKLAGSLQLYMPNPNAQVVTEINIVEGIKPQAKIWTSAAKKIGDAYTSEWAEWTKMEMPSWYNETGVLYRIKPGARIVPIHSDNAARKISKLLGVPTKDSMSMLFSFPWKVLEERYDAIWHDPSRGGRGVFMSVWDVESTAWMNMNYLEKVATVQTTK